MYWVVTVDLVASRRLKERSEAQERILSSVRSVNRRMRRSLAVPFSLTAGDEWQGVARSGCAAYEAAQQFCRAVHPLTLRIGIGLGSIHTPFRRRSAEMDGPAFHRSRAALEAAKLGRHGIRFVIDDGSRSAVLDALQGLVEAVESTWAVRQREKTLLYLELGNETKVGRKLGVTQSDVHQALKAARARAYKDGVKAIELLLAEADHE